ncbi:CPBP family intramembrane glutamic endopeptidase [Staphylococcus cohnii]|uniref:CPBP family intramembrane glutamic endopeptidase n=1 Tax=Staphylococcus cohnii TaxID=29382 RepID=UPI000D1A860A|nr:CPBP family intramembrane glutamic endopeptidase [Staphylococcus cohnii]PTF05468.1 lysostaphin resistance protein A [Staphylococcus cohnii]PTG66759.1 lysostaphin resistance protein A [Staphylococcus cohnii]
MNKQRISGFQWAIMIFIFFIIAYAAPIILKDLQSTISLKTFVFDLSAIAPFIAALICIIVFSNRKAQLSGLKLTIDLKVIERILLAFILPLVIFLIAMVSFNIFADSFVLLQAEDLSVSITAIILGQLVMAFLIEFGFRSYLQNIIETKMNTFFASIIVGILYSIWNINMVFSLEYTLYGLLYTFAFSMIIGELIRATKGRTIYIATIFHAAMSFGLVFLFNEELGSVFAMKVIALSTSAVAVVYILLSIIIRAILYFFTKRSLDEVDNNNYLDHVNEYSEAPQEEDSSETPDDATTKAQVHTEDDEHSESTTSQTEEATDKHINSDDADSKTSTELMDDTDTQNNHQQTNHDDSRNNIIDENTPQTPENNNVQGEHNHVKTQVNGAVENSTERAQTEATSTEHDNDQNTSETITQQNKKRQRSPFKLKNKRDHRR